MPPSSRSQVSQSQSLVLSHSSLLPASSQQAEGETFASASTATLPLRYRISLAVPPCDFPPSLKEAHAHHVRGEEYLSDAWRRIGEEEGLLDKRKEELRNGRAVRPVGRGVEFASPGAVPGVERGPLWFTASFRIPCLCRSRQDPEVSQLIAMQVRYQDSLAPSLQPDHLSAPSSSPLSQLTPFQGRSLASETISHPGHLHFRRSTWILTWTSSKISVILGRKQMAVDGAEDDAIHLAMACFLLNMVMAWTRQPLSRSRRDGVGRARGEKMAQSGYSSL